MIEDSELLRRYVVERAQDAFAELVRRRVDLVYSVALARVGGDAHLAEDVTQRVFADLARKAPTLMERAVLSGWLFRSAQYAASDVVRSERRRRNREQQTSLMHELNSATDAPIDWDKVRPLLDDALGELSETDRDAIALRFFEGRPLADVGRALHLAEDTARKRVERALDKLAATLARRGISSTSSALGVALANQATFASAPSGLAVDITTTALGGAAMAAGATGISGVVTLMKLCSGITAAAIALTVSLAGNAWLLFQPPLSRIENVETERAHPTPQDVKTAGVTFAMLRTEGAAALRDRLRAAGVSEAMTRSVVESVLRRRYRETLSENRAELMRTAWWRDSSWWWQPARAEGPPRFTDDTALLRELVLDPLEKLFGPDPNDLAEREARFDFLPSSKRMAFVTLERDHDAAMARLPGTDQNGSPGATLNRERDEKRRELLAGLSDAERAEYDLRFSNTAVAVRERMHLIGASQQEYRAIMAIVAPPGEDEQIARLPAETKSMEQRTARLVAALGYDRSLDYVWSGAWEYPNYARAASEAGLPSNTAGRVLELAAETMARAAEIHGDAALTSGQKRAAVEALQQSVQPRLDALLPPAVQAQLAPPNLDWFVALASGRYKHIPTSAGGNAGGIISPGTISVEAPAPSVGARQQFVMRRPQGG